MMLNKQFLLRLRSILIEMLNCIDDELIAEGAIQCRTIPTKSVRRKQRAMINDIMGG